MHVLRESLGINIYKTGFLDRATTHLNERREKRVIVSSKKP